MFFIPFAVAELPPASIPGVPSVFCEKAARRGYACDPGLIQKTRLPFDKHLKAVPFENREALQQGLALFLADKAKRKQHASSVQLDGLLSQKAEYQPRKFNDVRDEEAQLVQKTQLKSFFKVRALKGKALDQNAPLGASQATERVLDAESGEQGFFKRDKKSSTKLALKRVHAEVAAYKLSELLGLGLVPKTELRAYKGKLGSFQKEVEPHFVPLRTLDHQTLFKESTMKPKVEELKLFSYLGSVKDRHTDNLFVDPKSGQIRSVDHETAFHFVVPTPIKEDKRFVEHGVLPQEYSDTVRAKLHSLKYEEVDKTFKSTLTKEQREALWLRIQTARAHMLQSER